MYIRGLLITILLAGASIFKTAPEELPQVRLRIQPLPQQAKARTWVEPDVSPRFVLGDTREEYFYFAWVKTDPEGNLYVVDQSRFVVLKFSGETGELLATIGKGRGQGPGEIQTPTGFDIAPNGDLYLADAANSRVTVFSSEGTLKHIYSMKAPPYRVAAGEAGFVVSLLEPTDTGLFVAYNPAGKPLRRFGRLLEDQARHGLLLDGYIDLQGDMLVYVPSRMNWFATFSFSTGRLLYARYTMDQVPPPRLVREGSSIFIDRKAPWLTDLMEAEGHTLYIGRRGGKTLQTLMDVFTLSNGDYRFSVRPPAEGIPIKMGPYFLIARDTSITVYNWPDQNP